jgi:hypothetical protein
MTNIEEREKDIKGVSRSRNLKHRQCNDQKIRNKGINNNLKTLHRKL